MAWMRDTEMLPFFSLKFSKQTDVSAIIFFSIATQELLTCHMLKAATEQTHELLFMLVTENQSKGQKLHLRYRVLKEGLLGFYGTAFHGFWCNSDQCSTHRLPVSKDFGSSFIILKISAIWCKQYVIKVINKLIF